jgi:hypothetical protein
MEKSADSKKAGKKNSAKKKNFSSFGTKEAYGTGSEAWEAGIIF